MPANTTLALAQAAATEAGYSAEKLQLVKDNIARGATDDELALFLYTAHRAGLDPMARQVYCIKRWNGDLGRYVMTTQVSIDGLRLIADRTGRYAPGRAPSYEYDKNGDLVAATSYVMKYVQGTWHEVAATARYSEYVVTNKDGKPNTMWGNKPHIMLAKCAEALALRRAFPAEMSGLYTADEMGDDEPAARPVLPAVKVQPVTGEIIDATVTAPSTPPAPVQASEPPANGKRVSAVSRYQRDKLMELYRETFGADDATADAGIDALFQQQFGHGVDDGTYNEAAHITAKLLGMQRKGETESPANANGHNAPPEPAAKKPAPTSPADLLRVVNSRVEVAYDHVNHLLAAIRSEKGNAGWNWPAKDDVAGWRDAYAVAKKHADAKSQPAAAPVPDYEGGSEADAL